MLSLTLPHEKRAKLPSQLQTNVLYNLETIQSAITGSDSQSAINVESNPLIQGLPSITKRSHRVNSIHSKASKRSNNPIKPGGSSVSFDNAYSVQSLQTEGVPHNIDFKINQPSSTSPKSVRISDHSPRQITPRLSATTKSVIPAALPPSFQTTPLPLMPNNKSSSQSSLDVNASAASFDSQDMKEFIQEVKAMAGSPPKKPQDQFETKINASPKDPAGTLFHNDSKEQQQSPTSGRKFEASMPVAPSGTLKRGKPSIGKGNIVGLHNIMSNTSLNNPNARLKQNATLLSFLQDIISYSCLIPAFDSKGRRVTIDQFNGSDFEGISFVMNGLHPKSLFITAFDMLMVIVHICVWGLSRFL
ncbi:hypothetical protein BCR33DRAFT_326366 [Rhizoclosmatium globosum]|uniref:Uncharacterized protein n=1 Tax=Rhizoclosmatium globosum TaxID=329046 RepID=A0A1Y2C478_9FUNG|nr:hypothetical protein BCR33DRAFT_326366 [Rhizoclosmatium globosum]|eukprot:ORY41853.1 hypothetical protein BCR33DRAFT_326366 [Rhizoclosmatium globosum]